MKIQKMVGVLCLVLCWLASAGPAQAAQNSQRVRSELRPNVIKLGDVGEVIIQVEDASDVRIIEVPKVEGIDLGQVSPPSRREMQDGRGVISRTLTYLMRFKPEKTGEYRIGPIRLSVDGQELSTRVMTLSVVKDLDGARFGLLEFVDFPERVYDGEVFTIELRFGWDDQLKAINSADLRLPWWGNLSGVLEVPSDEPDLSGKPTRVNINSEDQIDVMEQLSKLTVDGRPFRTFILKRKFVATRPGTLQIPKSFLAFAIVESGGIFNSQQRTRQQYHKPMDGRTLEVLELPQAGRPLDYSKAVGRFHVRAQTDRWDVDAGDSIKLTVEWLGKGNLEFFERPDLGRLDGFEGFRSYGVSRDSFIGDRRIVTYDIAPLSPQITEIPSVPLSVFDTELGKYNTISTEPIQIRVRALKGETPLELAGEGGRAYDITDVQPMTGDPEPDSLIGTRTVLLGVFLSPLLAFGLRLLVRRKGDPNSEVMKRKRRARRSLARALAKCDSASAQSRAFHSFLGARTNEGDAAWIGRDVSEFNEDGVLSDKAASSLQQLLQQLDQSAYAKSDEPLPRAELLSVADQVMQGGL